LFKMWAKCALEVSILVCAEGGCERWD